MYLVSMNFIRIGSSDSYSSALAFKDRAYFFKKMQPLTNAFTFL